MPFAERKCLRIALCSYEIAACGGAIVCNVISTMVLVVTELQLINGLTPAMPGDNYIRHNAGRIPMLGAYFAAPRQHYPEMRMPVISHHMPE